MAGEEFKNVTAAPFGRGREMYQYLSRGFLLERIAEYFGVSPKICEQMIKRHLESLNREMAKGHTDSPDY